MLLKKISKAIDVFNILQWLLSKEIITSSIIGLVTIYSSINNNLPLYEIIFYLSGAIAFVLISWVCIHYLSGQISVKYKLSYEGSLVKLFLYDNNEGVCDIQAGLKFKNDSNKKLYYEIESIIVTIDDKTINEPHFRNKGGYILPGKYDVFEYDKITEIKKQPQLFGKIEYICKYGPSEKSLKYKIKQKMYALGNCV